MNTVLVLGAGMVVRPFLAYLFENTDVHIKVASLEVSEAIQKLVQGHDRGEIIDLNIEDALAFNAAVEDPDVALVASFVPPVYHPQVARACIRSRKSMLMTSYVSPELRQMDQEARDAGILIIGETGFDPGIDHMIAMSTIDHIRSQDGEVTGYASYCGALPAPEASLNPLGYKFSWHPRGALSAALRPAQFLQNGHKVSIASQNVFEHYSLKLIQDFGWLETYPNMDATQYLDTYTIPEVKSIYRGSLRYVGWGETMKHCVQLGIMDQEPIPELAKMTMKQLMAHLIGSSDAADMHQAVADRLHIDRDSAFIKKLEWLDLFSEFSIPGNLTSAFDVLLHAMQDKMAYGPLERDMVILQDEISFRLPTSQEELKKVCTLIEYGQPGGDSSIARTVGLPAAIGARFMLQGRISLHGVHIPVQPEVYEPVLSELLKEGISFQEQTVPTQGGLR